MARVLEHACADEATFIAEEGEGHLLRVTGIFVRFIPRGDLDASYPGFLLKNLD